jgi:acylphosphatase
MTDARRPERLRAVVRGRVQGVGFRWSVWRRAEQLGLAGWARNRPDGSVVVEAEGPADALDELEAFLKVGPPLAQVDSLDTERRQATGGFDGFEAN